MIGSHHETKQFLTAVQHQMLRNSILYSDGVQVEVELFGIKSMGGK